ncbi:MAG: choice-of-anchor M domain-containing protein, partial [Acidimicrobiia bacterium]
MAGFVASSVVAGVAVVLPSSPAPAAEGPAPAPRSLTVIADVHTDAVATFLDGGELVLGTLADLPEPGTRYVPEEVWFHVDDDSLTTLPDGFGFIGEAGSPVWIAPMANPGPTQLWPGFSTDSVPLGAIDGDQTTFALVGVEGPGDVEVYTNDGLGGVDRLWSSDEAFGSFTVGQAHLHANWAFTAPGTYELVVAASATIDGAPVGDTATYTFVVGPLAGPVATQTYLQNDGADVVTAGTPVELFASVLPLVGGYVEFRSGSTVLGHQEVSEWGEAPFVTDALPVGPHSITASFVPEVANVANGSTSAPVEVTVTSPSGVEFAVVGVEGPYLPGDTLSVQAVGLTLGSDQWFRWQWRAIGTADFDLGDPTSDPTYTRDLSASDHGYEVAVGVWQCEEWDSYCNYEPTLIARSAWVPVTVLGIGDPIVAELLTSDHAHLGDEAAIAVSGRELGEGEVLEVVRRDGRYGSTWWNDELFVQDGGVVHLYLTGGGEFAVRVLSDGLVVAQSEPFSITVDPYEVQIAGVQGVYRPGATQHAQAIVYPESPDLYNEWSYFVPGGLPYEMVEEGYGPEAAT